MNEKYRPPSFPPPKRRQRPRWSKQSPNNITTTSTTSASNYDPNDPNQPLPQPIEAHWTEEEALHSPAVDRGIRRQQLRRPPLSSVLPRVRYDLPKTSTNIGAVTVTPNSQYGKRRPSSIRDAAPGAAPLEPLIRGTQTFETAFKPGQPVQAFYELDQSWYDAHVVKIVPKRMTRRQKAAAAANNDMQQNAYVTVVQFDDGFPGEHVVEHVRERSMYPLNLGKSVESLDYGRVPYSGVKGIPVPRNKFGQTPLQALTPDAMSRAPTPGEKRTFPFKYKISGKRSIKGSDAPFTARVSMDADDNEANLQLVKRFRDYYFDEKDIVDAAMVNAFKNAVIVQREKELEKARAPPRPRSALPAGRRVPPSWMKRNRRSFLPKGPRPSSLLLGERNHTFKNSKSTKTKRPLSWRDYIWCHMHNWHFAGTGPGVLTKKQYQTLYRAVTRDQKQREKLIRDIEIISSFRIDVNLIDKMLQNLADRAITKAEAKDRAVVIVDRTIGGCGRGVAPVSALRALHVVDSDKARETKALRRSLLERLYQAIDDDWGPGDSSGDIGPDLRWNMSHPGFDQVLITEAKRKFLSGKGSNETIGNKIQSHDTALVPATTVVLNKAKIKAWSARMTSNTPPNEISMSTVHLTLTRSHFGTSIGSDVLSSGLFQSLPNLIVLNLSRCTIDSRSLEGLARGLTALPPKNKGELTVKTGNVNAPRYAAAHLEVLILDSNFATRGRPMTRARKQKILRERNKELRRQKEMGLNIRTKNKSFSTENSLIQKREEVSDSNEEFFDEDLTGLEALGLALRKHPKIKKLSFRKNQLGLDGSRRFIRRLLSTTVYTGPHACPSTIEHLSLASCGISNKGFVAVREMSWDFRNKILRGNNATLLSLDVSHNKIDHAGIHSFFEPPPNDLEKPRSLRTLILRQNDLSLLSVQTIVAAVKSKAWLQLSTLDISFCNIGDIGCRLIASMLKINQTLTSLNLSSCNLTNNGTKFKGALELISVLQNDNRKLLHLDLSSNTLVRRKLGRFDDEDACGWSLVNLILSNHQIQTLNIKNNAFGLKVRFALKNAIVKAPYAELDQDRKIAFWMCKQKRLGKNSPARILWYGMLSYITDFLAKRRDKGEILF
jgi:hypothetical protein